MKKVRQLISLMLVATVALMCLPLFDMVYMYPSASRLVTDEIRKELEEVGRHLAAEIRLTGGKADVLATLEDARAIVDLESLVVRSAEGALLFPAAEGMAPVQNFKALSLLAKGQSFSRTVFEMNADQPRQLMEVQIPVLDDGELVRVVVLSKDISRFKETFDSLISKATLFLFLIAFVVLVIVIWTATMAHRAINHQIETDLSLGQSRAELERQHRELEYVFDQVAKAKTEWQLAMDCIDDMILLIDGDARIRRCNEALVQFLGFSYIEVLGKDWRKVLQNGTGEMADLDQGSGSLYHEKSRTWLQLDFYPYRDSESDAMTVLRIQKTGPERELCAS